MARDPLVQCCRKSPSVINLKLNGPDRIKQRNTPTPNPTYNLLVILWDMESQGFWKEKTFCKCPERPILRVGIDSTHIHRSITAIFYVIAKKVALVWLVYQQAFHFADHAVTFHQIESLISFAAL